MVHLVHLNSRCYQTFRGGRNVPLEAFGGGKPPRGTSRQHKIFHCYFRWALYAGKLRQDIWPTVEPPSAVGQSYSWILQPPCATDRRSQSSAQSVPPTIRMTSTTTIRISPSIRTALHIYPTPLHVEEASYTCESGTGAFWVLRRITSR